MKNVVSWLRFEQNTSETQAKSVTAPPSNLVLCGVQFGDMSSLKFQKKLKIVSKGS
jgi:hypothetical protein